MKVFRVALVIYDRTLLRKAFLIAKNIVEREKKEKNTSTTTMYYISHHRTAHTHIRNLNKMSIVQK